MDFKLCIYTDNVFILQETQFNSIIYILDKAESILAFYFCAMHMSALENIWHAVKKKKKWVLGIESRCDKGSKQNLELVSFSIFELWQTSLHPDVP